MDQDKKIILGIVAVSVVLLVGAGMFFTKQGSGQQQQTTVKQVDESILVKEDSFKIATESAQVTMVEFSDLQCPACKLAQPVLQRILEEFGGELNFVYRHFPLTTIHKNAVAAAKAAEAAGQQEKFFEMVEVIFENQDSWAEERNPEEKFVGYAGELGLDLDKFREAMESEAVADKVKRDQNDGFTAGVNSTPTFFVNGKNVGALTYPDLKAAVENEIGDK